MALAGRRLRGASTVEYALLLVAVLLVAAGSWKLLGGKVGTRSSAAGNVVASEGAGGGGGKTGGVGKTTVTSKVSVGSVGGGGGDGDQGGATRSASQDTGGNADVSEAFTPKRWMGVGLLAAGVLAIGYVVGTMRRAKKAADAAGPSKDAGGRRRRSKR